MNRLYLSIFTAALTVLGSTGCSRRTPAATVVLVDPSASVTQRGRKEEFAAVEGLIPRMQRGDLLVVIPITDNAAADIEGRVLRLRAPEHREAYDADLGQFRRSADTQYAGFASDLLAKPGQRTDIIGALDVAQQELRAIPSSDQRYLIVLSDFLEDDGMYRFKTDLNLADEERALTLARRLAMEHTFALHSIVVYLGATESTDFRHLDSTRQRAVRTFWSSYFALGASRVEVRYDGPALLSAQSNYQGRSE